MWQVIVIDNISDVIDPCLVAFMAINALISKWCMALYDTSYLLAPGLSLYS